MTWVGELYPPGKVTLREVGLRDGMQLVRRFPATGAKLDWIESEAAAGVRHFEVVLSCQLRACRSSPMFAI